MNWDYIAGFFDGEGSLSFSVGKTNKEHRVFRLFLSLSNNNYEVLEKAKSFLEMGTIHTKPSKNPNARTSHLFQVSGFKILPILKELLPRIIIKKQQVALAIAFIEHRQSGKLTRTYTEEDVQFVAKMRKLNNRSPQKGHPITCLDDIKTTNRPVGRPRNSTP